MNQPSKQFWDVLLKRAASDCANAIELYIQTERERESLIEPTPGRSKGKTRNRGGQPRSRKRKPLLVKNRISADTYLPTPLVGSAWNGIYGIAGFSPSPDSPPSTSIFHFSRWWHGQIASGCTCGCRYLTAGRPARVRALPLKAAHKNAPQRGKRQAFCKNHEGRVRHVPQSNARPGGRYF